MQERAMWMAHQLATPRAYGAAPVPLIGTSNTATRHRHASSNPSTSSADFATSSNRGTDDEENISTNAQRSAVLETIAPNWRSLQKQVMDLDVREVLKWCVGIWEPTDTDVE